MWALASKSKSGNRVQYGPGRGLEVMCLVGVTPREIVGLCSDISCFGMFVVVAKSWNQSALAVAMVMLTGSNSTYSFQNTQFSSLVDRVLELRTLSSTLQRLQASGIRQWVPLRWLVLEGKDFLSVNRCQA